MPLLAIAGEWSAEDRVLVVHFGLEGLIANPPTVGLPKSGFGFATDRREVGR